MKKTFVYDRILKREYIAQARGKNEKNEQRKDFTF